MDYEIFQLGNVVLQHGATLRDAHLAYKTYGKLNADKSNVIVYPTWYSGQHTDNEWLIGKGMALDPDHYFIIVPNMLGNGLSSLSNNVKDMGTLSNAAVATNEYAENASKAAKNMNAIADSSAMVSDSMGNFSAGLQGALTNINSTEAATAEFAGELSKLNRNLSNLNSIYGNMLSAMGASKA
jgi:homoserine acetyltransferase